MIIFHSILPNADLKTNFYNAGLCIHQQFTENIHYLSMYIHLVYFIC